MIYYPVWVQGVTPHANKKARINKYRDVQDVRVVMVFNGRYRGASLTDVFELEDQTSGDSPIKELPSGKFKVTVICGWYGVKPPNTYPSIDISSGAYQIITGYSGPVADNIGD